MKSPSDVLLTLLPVSQQDRAKAYLAAIGATAAAVAPLVPHVPEGVGVLIAVLTGLGVFGQANGLTTRQRAIADAVAASTPVLEDAVGVTRDTVARVKAGAPLVEVAAEALPRAVVTVDAATEAVRRAVEAAFTDEVKPAVPVSALPPIAPVVLEPAPVAPPVPGGATEMIAAVAAEEAARQAESVPAAPVRPLRVSQYRQQG